MGGASADLWRAEFIDLWCGEFVDLWCVGRVCSAGDCYRSVVPYGTVEFVGLWLCRSVGLYGTAVRG